MRSMGAHDIFLIRYSEEIASFVAHTSEKKNWLPSLNVGTMKNYEVIGNIHDNRSLL